MKWRFLLSEALKITSALKPSFLVAFFFKEWPWGPPHFVELMPHRLSGKSPLRSSQYSRLMKWNTHSSCKRGRSWVILLINKMYCAVVFQSAQKQIIVAILFICIIFHITFNNLKFSFTSNLCFEWHFERLIMKWSV